MRYVILACVVALAGALTLLLEELLDAIAAPYRARGRPPSDGAPVAVVRVGPRGVPEARRMESVRLASGVALALGVRAPRTMHGGAS